MKVIGNIYLVSGHCWKGLQGQRSRWWPDQLTYNGGDVNFDDVASTVKVTRTRFNVLWVKFIYNKHYRPIVELSFCHLDGAQSNATPHPTTIALNILNSAVMCSHVYCIISISYHISISFYSHCIMVAFVNFLINERWWWWWCRSFTDSVTQSSCLQWRRVSPRSTQLKQAPTRTPPSAAVSPSMCRLYRHRRSAWPPTTEMTSTSGLDDVVPSSSKSEVRRRDRCFSRSRQPGTPRVKCL